jgi:hypothetical protein
VAAPVADDLPSIALEVVWAGDAAPPEVHAVVDTARAVARAEGWIGTR